MQLARELLLRAFAVSDRLANIKRDSRSNLPEVCAYAEIDRQYEA